VDRRLDIAVVGQVDGDLRPVVDVQRRAGDRAVVMEHPAVVAGNTLAYRSEAQLIRVAVARPDDRLRVCLGQAGGVGRESSGGKRRAWGVQDRPQVGGDRHRLERADIGAAGVPNRVPPGQGPWSGHNEAEQLADDLATVMAPECAVEHGQVGADVWSHHRLAQDVGPLKVPPFPEHVLSASGLSCRRPLSGPCVVQGRGSSRHDLVS
jgi:hypothetical protein